MKRPLALTGVALLLALALTGCTATPATTAPTAVPATAVPATAVPPTAVPPTAVPATAVPPTTAPTEAPATVAPTTAAPATEAPTTATELSADAVRGGKLYDDWMKELESDAPEGNSPMWAAQSTNEREGKDTWRCKECHGWDYKGVEGAYGSGSHKTGFPGILGAAERTTEELTAQLDGTKNPLHDFSDHFTAEAMNQMIAFIQDGLVDSSDFIMTDKSIPGGDVDNGKSLFEGTCQACHGADGKTLNFGDADAPEYIGTLAADNPWEVFHKVSFGQPDEVLMPSARALGWPQQDIIDVLTYAQTLPVK